MFKKRDITINEVEEWLKDNSKAQAEIKDMLLRFIQDRANSTRGAIILSWDARDVYVDGTKASEPDVIWAFAKAQHQVFNKRLFFD